MYQSIKGEIYWASSMERIKFLGIILLSDEESFGKGADGNWNHQRYKSKMDYNHTNLAFWQTYLASFGWNFKDINLIVFFTKWTKFT